MTTIAYKTRFAPSPTGQLHLGNVRTALFSALLAKRNGGVFLLRIEDTDQGRSMPEYTRALQEDLQWLGLEWQEGPQVGGPYGPYLQSERGAVYQGYFEALERAGLAYPCFCSGRELELLRKTQRAAGQPPRYPGTCANLRPEEVEERLRRGLRPTLRFRVPRDRAVEFDDLVRGRQVFTTNDIGDFIIRRADDTPAFFFSNAVDDALMGVTHVLRGEDHLTNTPRQILLLEALGLRIPVYGHIAMIVGADGSPLSKRRGSRSVRELREAGYLPGGVINYLARLGHYYEQDVYMNLDALAAGFDVAHLGRAPARYDEGQLLRWQREAVARAGADELWSWMGDEVHALVPRDAAPEFVELVRENIAFPADALRWARIIYADQLELSPEAREVVCQAGRAFFEHAMNAWQDHAGNFKAWTAAVKDSAGVKGKALFEPLRVALTGQAHGPELRRVVEMMPAGRVRTRLETCLAPCAGNVPLV